MWFLLYYSCLINQGHPCRPPLKTVYFFEAVGYKEGEMKCIVHLCTNYVQEPKKTDFIETF